MILGRDVHPASRCFDELEAAIGALTARTVCLNAHAFPLHVPPGAVVFNLENVGLQVPPTAFEGHEIWDFSAHNVEAWKAAGRLATHVPIGYHPSMERFKMRPWEERDIDVVFCGVVNERRKVILDALIARGLTVSVIGPGEAYGAERDAVLARSKLALNFLQFEYGTFPVLRAAHAAANRLPMLSERAREMPPWVSYVTRYEDLVEAACDALRDRPGLENLADIAHAGFTRTPFALPDHWGAVFDAPELTPEVIEKGFLHQRGGLPVSPTPHVLIAMPAYVTPEAAVRASVGRIVADLHEHGIDATLFESPGDSLVTRGRHGLMHAALCSTATHLLQWDADIECLDATAVRHMVLSGFDVVGGAYPWRDGSGRVVCNPLPDTVKDQHVDIDPETKCLKVAEVGTGFLLTSRKMLVDLCSKHPELLYMADIEPYVGAPMWALFDAHLEHRAETGRRRYASEDWRFCQLAREAGYDIHVYYPPIFRHWGKFPHAGHITKSWGMGETREGSAPQ